MNLVGPFNFFCSHIYKSDIGKKTIVVCAANLLVIVIIRVSTLIARQQPLWNNGNQLWCHQLLAVFLRVGVIHILRTSREVTDVTASWKYIWKVDIKPSIFLFRCKLASIRYIRIISYHTLIISAKFRPYRTGQYGGVSFRRSKSEGISSWCSSVLPSAPNSEWDLWRFETRASNAVLALFWRATVPFRFLGIVQWENGFRHPSIWLSTSYFGNSAMSWCIFLNPIAFTHHTTHFKQVLCSTFPIIVWWIWFRPHFILMKGSLSILGAVTFCSRDVRRMWMTPTLCHGTPWSEVQQVYQSAWADGLVCSSRRRCGASQWFYCQSCTLRQFLRCTGHQFDGLNMSFNFHCTQTTYMMESIDERMNY